MICGSCGASLVDGAAFCSACGRGTATTQVSVAPRVPVAPVASMPSAIAGPRCPSCGSQRLQEITEAKGSRFLGCLLIAAGILLAPLVIGLILIVLAIGQFKTESYFLCPDCRVKTPRARR